MPAPAANPSHRFANVLNPNGTTLPFYDRPLLETEHWLLVPTLGPIIPNWFLILPRRYFINLRSFRDFHGIEPLTLLTSFCDHLNLTNSDVLWFEHGPTASNTALACGTDHAHLHLLVRPPFSFAAFSRCIVEHSPFSWTRRPARVAYNGLHTGNSYLVAGKGNDAIIAENISSHHSQFFRRQIASLVGCPHAWNYRDHAYRANIRETIHTFNSLEPTREQ